MRTAKTCALTLTSALAATACAFSYQLDDDTTEAFLGVAPRVTVLNQYRVQPGLTTIDEVNVVFANDIGIPVKVVLWTDPNQDGLPHDAVPARIVDTVTPDDRGMRSLSYFFDPIRLPVNAVFYVGIYVSQTHTGRRVHGWAHVDLSHNWRRSWVAFGDDVWDLSSAQRLDERYPRLQGSFELRANAVPEPSGMATLALGALLWRVRPSGRA